MENKIFIIAILALTTIISLFTNYYTFSWLNILIVLGIVLINQIYRTIKCFSNSIKTKETTDWFYRDENIRRKNKCHIIHHQ